MQWFYNLKIAAKLLVGFIVMALITGIVGILGVVNLTSINESYTTMYNENTKPLGNLAIIGTQFQRVRLNERNIILDMNNAQEYLHRIDGFNQTIDINIDAYKKELSTEEEAKELEVLTTLMDRLKPLREKVLNLLVTGQIEAAQKMLFEELDPLSREADEQITKLLAMNIDLGNTIAEDNTSQAKSAKTLMLFAIGAAIIISMGLGFFISHLISNPVKQMAQAADKLAMGDVNVNIKAHTKDEIGKLAESFGKMISNIREQAMAAERIAAGDLTIEVAVRSENDLLGKKLCEMVEKNNEVLTNIASASEQVAAGSRQVSDSSISLSEGATEQASSIEELTASLEEISSQTNLNAQNANQANQLAENAKTNAVEGNSQMKEMLQAMEEINESSGNISKIIKVIDEIAFQTNILALNAAVEAARAGQHGKGFAVVAEEVRNLAARSASAAKETTDMIEGSIKKVAIGTEIARGTAEALGEIVNSIEKVATLVNDIAVASNEQASGIGQINQGIMQVSQVVQTNSVTSEESAAASEELSGQAEFLRELVSQFKLRQNNKSFNKTNNLNPEILKMLEDLSQKKTTPFNVQEKFGDETPVSKTKISLSYR
ncbi:MAG: methyl-accepting chemotaxis protein [Thermotaleaceae bacterium]